MPEEKDTFLISRELWKIFGDVGAEVFAENTQPGGETPLARARRLRERGCIMGAMDINLDIRRGELFVFMGLSGSGKSTLLRCFSRLTEPTAGQVIFDGQDLLQMSPRDLVEIRRRKMGMVFQHFGLFPHMSVLENVAFPLRVQGVPQAQREEKAREMIELVGLQGRERALIMQLSGGQKQRVGIARSLAVDPELWLLDEPFSALDPVIRCQMQTELIRLQNMFHKTICFVTHDFMEAVRLADRIAIMKDGQIVQVGTPSEIVLSPADDYVAEFVQEAPRTKIIKVSQLLQPLTTGAKTRTDGGALTPDMTLEDALSWSAERGGALPVEDKNGVMIGQVSPEILAAALSGAEQERDR